MADDHTDGTLSRRRLLASLTTIGGSLSAAGVGTWALFSDRERGDLTVRAGTVSLSAGDGSDSTITVDGVEAGGSGTERLELTNTGSIDAGLSVCVDGVAVADADLAEQLSLSLGVAPENASAETLFDDVDVASLTDGATCREASTPLAGGETADLVVDWTADESADRLDGELTIDLTVTLQT